MEAGKLLSDDFIEGVFDDSYGAPFRLLTILLCFPHW